MVTLTMLACPGLSERQVQSTFHDLKRAAPADTPTPTEDDYRAYLRHVQMALTTDEEHRVGPRLAQALATGQRPDGPTFTALQQLRGQAAAAEAALGAAMRRIGAARYADIGLDHPLYADHMAAAEKEARARYAAFAALAAADRNLRAPGGWIAQYRATSGHTAAVPADRITAYALWRAHSTGVDFAPADYDPTRCFSIVTIDGADSWRPGDVIDEPGASRPGDVAHEGKTVAAVHRDTSGHAVRVDFTDGSHGDRFHHTHTIYRPANPTEAAAVATYAEVSDRALVIDRDPELGWYAVDPDTGHRVYDPLG